MRSKKKNASEGIYIDDKPLTVDEAADFLGIKPDTMYKRIRNGISPPYHKQGKRRYYFLRSEIIEHIKNN